MFDYSSSQISETHFGQDKLVQGSVPMGIEDSAGSTLNSKYALLTRCANGKFFPRLFEKGYIQIQIVVACLYFQSAI